MMELSIHDVEWCPHHGHPVLILREEGGDRYVAVALSAEDAQALSASACGTAASRVRLCGTIHEMLAGLGARLYDVSLDLAENGLLRACLWLDGPEGGSMVPAHATDGILLARMAGLPLRMPDEDLKRVGHPMLSAKNTGGREASAPSEPDNLAPFRRFLESLNSEESHGNNGV